MQHAGEQLQFSIKGNLRQDSPTGTRLNVDADGEIIVVGEHEVYLSIRSLTTKPPHAIFQEPEWTRLLGTWLKLPSTGSPSSHIVTPDPSMLRMQMEAVRVVRDNGIVTWNGQDVYAYDVEIDPARLQTFLSEIQGQVDAEKEMQLLKNMEAKGNVWIDAQTFLLRRVEWTIKTKAPEPPLTITFNMDITDHNTDIKISPPDSSIPLPSSSFLLLPELLRESAQVDTSASGDTINGNASSSD